MTRERQALIDIVPILTKIEAGDCESFPYESCSRSCERLGERALDIVLDALSPYPGCDRWNEPPQPDPAKDAGRCPECTFIQATARCRAHRGTGRSPGQGEGA